MPSVQAQLREFLSDPDRGRPRVQQADKAYIDFEREESEENEEDHDANKQKCVQVVLSDMCEPWPATGNPFLRSLTQPHFRLMNTSGISFRDHAQSMVSASGRRRVCWWLTGWVGPVSCGPLILPGRTQARRPLCLQVLSRRGR
jgi:23S rRNA U2552 (ribose-2'-O)-methylase RlmE/FtsJ